MTEEDFDNLFELMSEPPGGHNHGREKSDQGTWVPLETPGEDSPSIKRSPVPIKHGTVYGYSKQGCRCQFCRLIQSQRDKGRKRKGGANHLR